MLCTIWYHLYNFKNAKNTHGGVLLLVKLQAEVCNFIKSSTPLWVFLTFFKLYRRYQIAQRTTYGNKNLSIDTSPKTIIFIRVQLTIISYVSIIWIRSFFSLEQLPIPFFSVLISPYWKHTEINQYTWDVPWICCLPWPEHQRRYLENFCVLLIPSHRSWFLLKLYGKRTTTIS